jgi:hypothetical protein
MKRIISLIGLSLIILFTSSGCNDKSIDIKSNLTETPPVKKTAINYNKESFGNSFPDSEILHKIADAYKNNYSQEIKTELIEYMKAQVILLGENQETFNRCIDLTDCENINSISLPTNAEKAKYDGEDVWIIQLVWGMEPSDLGHYKCFAISAVNYDTLDYKRCR